MNVDVFADKIKKYVSSKGGSERSMTSCKTIITEYGKYIHVEIVQPTQKTFINVSNEFSWEEIQTCIDVHLECELSRTCPRCSVTDQEKVFRVSCPKCACYWCNACYLKMIRQYYDVDILCPRCQFNINTHTCFMEKGEWNTRQNI